MQYNINQSKILIVDDDKYIRDFLSILLSGSGYVCYTASDGLEALKKASEIHPDIIFLDLLMLGMHGLEVCKRLKSNPGTFSIPVIIITVSIDYELKNKCFEAGASDFITKPLNPQEINIKTWNLLQTKEYSEIKSEYSLLQQTLTLVEKAKREWELTVDCINDIIILIDQNDKILRTNKTLATIANAKFTDLLGRKWQDVFKENNFNHTVFSSGDIELYHPSGRYYSYNLYNIEHFVNANQFESVIILQDITGIKYMTRQLEESREILEKKNIELEKAYSELKSAQSQILQQEKMASIGQLAAGVAHEINNPTGFIMSNLNTLLKYTGRIKEFVSSQTEAIDALSKGAANSKEIFDRLKEKRREIKFDHIIDDLDNLVGESLEGAERVKRIVQDLKSFSRVDEAEYKLADINAGIESTINIIWNELKYKANIGKEYGDIPRTKCNAGQLNQVFMNILMNAVQAIEDHGEIKIKTWYDAGKINISISDTGSGIPEDKINRIFEPFYTTKEVGMGTGLGLSIVYDIVHKHNGDIKVDSSLGAGTTFTIKLPVVNEER